MTMSPPFDMVRAQSIPDTAGRRRVHFLTVARHGSGHPDRLSDGQEPSSPPFLYCVRQRARDVGYRDGYLHHYRPDSLAANRHSVRPRQSATTVAYRHNLFAFMPFVYLFIQTPGQLLLVRLVYGFAPLTCSGCVQGSELL